MTGNSKLRVLFLCTGNSCRSQMAEGWTRALKGTVIEAYSAGTHPHGVNPIAIEVMKEDGVDLSRHRSKHIEELKDVDFDYVITVCANADRNCPVISGGAKRIHVGFDDPPQLAAGAGSRDEAMDHYRRVRDEVKEFVRKLPQALTQCSGR